jgi:hypothetical protein
VDSALPPWLPLRAALKPPSGFCTEGGTTFFLALLQLLPEEWVAAFLLAELGAAVVAEPPRPDKELFQGLAALADDPPDRGRGTPLS